MISPGCRSQLTVAQRVTFQIAIPIPLIVLANAKILSILHGIMQLMTAAHACTYSGKRISANFYPIPRPILHFIKGLLMYSNYTTNDWDGFT